MKILFVSATEFEILPLLDYLRNNFKNKDNIRFFSKELDIHILVSGVGVVHTTYTLTTFLLNNSIDLVINLGIAGAFNINFNLGQVFQVISDQFADIGVAQTHIVRFSLCHSIADYSRMHRNPHLKIYF